VTFDGWLPGYERHETENCGGYNDPDAECKNLWHSTESPFGSIDSVLRLFSGPVYDASHFVVDFGKPGQASRMAQCSPITKAACSLVGGGNVVSTNGVPVIQTEVCGYAAESHLWTDDVLRFLAQHAVNVRRAQQVALGRSFRHQVSVTFYGQDAGFIVASSSARQRLSPTAWRAYNGHVGHQHVPMNDHWDPGKLNVARICELAIQIEGGVTPPPPTPPTEELTVAEADRIIEVVNDDHNDTRRWMGTRPVKVAGKPEQYALLATPAGLVRQHLTGELKSVLTKARFLSDVGKEQGLDFIELRDPAEVAAFEALPVV
jgi:hypothetical protein